MFSWSGEDLDQKPEPGEIPAQWRAEAEKRRTLLIEALADFDEGIMEKYLEGAEVTEEEMRPVIRRATIACKLNPVVCGTALRNKGVQLMLDAVVDFLPSPTDLPPVSGFEPATEKEISRKPSDDEPFSALAFKIITDPHVGRLTFIRIYSGTLSAGTQVMNARTQRKERLGRLLEMHANDRTDLEEMRTGDIGAVIGCKDVTTGDTLCDLKYAVELMRPIFPEPVVRIAIEPKSKADQDKLSDALNKLSEEDPTFQVSVDHETGQTIIAGMGELHLEIIVDRMRREFKVEANVGKPMVAYRESVRSKAEEECKFVRQSGGRGQYGHVVLSVEPGEKGSGFVFEDEIVGGVIPREYIPGVMKGCKNALEGGPISGYPMVDVTVRLTYGSYHDVDSSEMAFEIAGSMAVKAAAAKANPVLLEPIMKVEVTVPEQYTGDVIGDINGRRGRMESMEPQGSVQKVLAHVPLADMFGYANDLRSKTQGRASFSMEFEHYEAVPSNVANEIMESRGSSYRFR